MKLLTLDIGNTTVDACVFVGEEPKHLGRLPHTEVEKLSGEYDLVLVSSVRSVLNEKLSELFGKRVRFLKLKDVSIELDYETPETLGIDRVLFAYGVRELYSDNAVLVMAGTALVVDLLLGGVFRGGFITAGLGLKLRALSDRAEGLPALEPEPVDSILGRSTRECLLAGTYRESKVFIEETAKRWSEEYRTQLPIYITGGDGKFFKELGVYDPLILHRAMCRIIINE
ncbi:type III pantothenate kinase [Hydrogenivirga sp.]